MSETVKDEIAAAKRSLGLTDADIRLLPDEEGWVVFGEVEAHFVGSAGRRWWWEDFRSPSTSVHFDDQRGFDRLSRIVPDGREKIWFIIEEDRLPFYPVYETSAAVAQKVIGECYGFEYYLVAKDFRWLLCETHHDVLIAIGEDVEANLKHHAAEAK